MSDNTKQVVIDITSQEHFQEEIAKSNALILVDFWAPWCGPCKQLSPVIEKLATDYQDTLIVMKVNIDHVPDIATQYGIRSIPTLKLFKNAAVIDTQIGALPESKIRSWIDTNLK